MSANKSVVDPITKDFFIGSYTDTTIPDLEYLFDKYLGSVLHGSPNNRAADNLKVFIDTIQLNYEYSQLSSKKWSPEEEKERIIFKVPVGVEKNKSYLRKIFDGFRE